MKLSWSKDIVLNCLMLNQALTMNITTPQLDWIPRNRKPKGSGKAISSEEKSSYQNNDPKAN